MYKNGILSPPLLCLVKHFKLDFLLHNLDEKSQAFLAFSVFTNGKKVLSYKKSRSTDTMHCLNGIRVISTQWVVMGHT